MFFIHIKHLRLLVNDCTIQIKLTLTRELYLYLIWSITSVIHCQIRTGGSENQYFQLKCIALYMWPLSTQVAFHPAIAPPTFPLQWARPASPPLAGAPRCRPGSSPSVARSPAAAAAGRHKTSTPWKSVPCDRRWCVCFRSRAAGCLGGGEKPMEQRRRQVEGRMEGWGWMG